VLDARTWRSSTRQVRQGWAGDQTRKKDCRVIGGASGDGAGTGDDLLNGAGRRGTAGGNPVLETTVVEIERHVAEAGWDQRPILFALVETADLLAREPALAAELGLAPGSVAPGSLTPIQQEDLGDGPLDEVLARVLWPAEVLGTALVHEAVVLPPSAEANAPQTPDAGPVDAEAAAAWAAAHPERRDVRMAVGVLRDGSRACALRLRAAEAGAEEDLLAGPDLAPGLVAALLATLEE